MDAAKAADAGSNESQAAITAPSRCAAASGETQSKPTCPLPGTIPKSAGFRDRASPKLAPWKVPDSENGVGNQSGAVALNPQFLKPTMAEHSPVLTLHSLDVLFS
jgi:hypothetical protein